MRLVLPAAPSVPWLAQAGPTLGTALHEIGKSLGWLSSKTGLPSLILVAAALVLALRLARKVGRIAVEFALALVLLLALRKLGWMF